MRKFAALLLLLPVLSACRSSEPPKPTLVNFNTDEQILRGEWQGQVALDGQSTALTLDLIASNPTDYSYAVTGTGTLGGRRFNVQGQVYALFNQKFVRPQTSPLPQGVQLRLVGEAETGTIFCPAVETVDAQPIWKCSYSNGTDVKTFDLRRSHP